MGNLIDGTVSVLRNQGNGTFAPQVVYPVEPGSGYVVTADVNADGKVDLVTANNNDRSISVIRNMGDGTFGEKHTYELEIFSPANLAVTDVDGDGAVDVVFTGGSAYDVWLLRNVGNGTLSEPVKYSLTYPISHISVADYSLTKRLLAAWRARSMRQSMRTGTRDELTIRDIELTIRDIPWREVRRVPFTQVRSASLTGYAEVARSVGLEPFAQLRAAGLDIRCLDDPDLKIPVLRLHALLESSAHAAGIEDFGLRMAMSRRLSNLGIISLAAREEPTVRDALYCLQRTMHLHNEAIHILVEEANDIAVIREQLLAPVRGTLRQGTELAVGVLYRIIREFLGPNWSPLAVCFTHQAPKDLAPYRKAFVSSEQFHSVLNGLTCPAAISTARCRRPIRSRCARCSATWPARPNASPRRPSARRT